MGLNRFSRMRGVQAVSTWMRGGGTGIVRIQRGTITIGPGATSNTATLASSVDVNRSRLLWLGTQTDDAGTSDGVCCRVALTNATTVTATVNSTAGADRVVSFEVIEYAPGVIKRILRSTLTTTGAPSGTATISAVDMGRATLDGLGFTTTGAGTAPSTAQGAWVLTNATTVTFTSRSAFDRTVGYQVIEWN